MTDNEVEMAIHKQLQKQLEQANIHIPVYVGFQPIKQAREDNRVIFFPTSEAGMGWQRRSYNIQGANANHKETQLAEKTYQVQVVITDLATFTATDITAIIRMIVNSLPFIEVLRQQGIGVQRATNIQIPYLIDEKSGQAQNPFFEFNVTFTRTLHLDTAATTALYPIFYPI